MINQEANHSMYKTNGKYDRIERRRIQRVNRSAPSLSGHIESHLEHRKAHTTVNQMDQNSSINPSESRAANVFPTAHGKLAKTDCFRSTKET